MSLAAAKAIWSASSGVGAFFQRNASWLVLALFAVVLWMLFRPFFRVLFGLVPQDADMQNGGGDVTAAFYGQRKNAAQRLNDTLTTNALSGDGRCEALYDALQWNENQLRLLHNTYKNAYGETLHSALSSTYTDDCSWMGMSDGQNSALLQKLNTLGLT